MRGTRDAQEESTSARAAAARGFDEFAQKSDGSLDGSQATLWIGDGGQKTCSAQSEG